MPDLHAGEVVGGDHLRVVPLLLRGGEILDLLADGEADAGAGELPERRAVARGRDHRARLQINLDLRWGN